MTPPQKRARIAFAEAVSFSDDPGTLFNLAEAVADFLYARASSLVTVDANELAAVHGATIVAQAMRLNGLTERHLNGGPRTVWTDDPHRMATGDIVRLPGDLLEEWLAIPA